MSRRRRCATVGHTWIRDEIASPIYEHMRRVQLQRCDHCGDTREVPMGASPLDAPPPTDIDHDEIRMGSDFQ